MQRRVFSILGISILAAASGFAQSYPRRATIVSGGNPDRGKCTIEVVIDGAAEVEIRGDTANLRNLSGQPPQWRRFECTGPMPANAANFRFAGVDGRGRQELARDPRNGGVAVIRLEDPQAGSEGYTFDIFWGGSGNFPAGDPRYTNDRNPPGGDRYPPNADRNPPGGDRYPPNADRNPPGGDRYPPNVDRGGDRGGGRWTPGSNQRMSADEAIRVCQESVQQQAEQRLQTRQLAFQRVTIDDNPGRNDWVIGTFEVRRYNRDEQYRFSCSVDFESGRVRSAQFEPADNGGRRPDDRGAFQACQRSVEQRLSRDGFRNANFDSMRYDNRRGRNDWIVGSARVDGRYGGQWFDFVCSTNDNGSVRVVDVTRR